MEGGTGKGLRIPTQAPLLPSPRNRHSCLGHQKDPHTTSVPTAVQGAVPACQLPCSSAWTGSGLHSPLPQSIFPPRHWLHCSEFVPTSTVQHQGLTLTIPCLELGDSSSLPGTCLDGFVLFLGLHCVGEGSLEFVILYREGVGWL